MDKQQSINAYFKMPFQFDGDKLQADLATCEAYEFQGNYIPENYDGDKYILPLRSVEGKMDHVVATQGASNQFKNTVALEQSPYFQEVIDQFQCEKESVRLMSLPGGAVINKHIDRQSGYEDGFFRIHVPVKTNDQTHFILEDNPIHMGVGEAWYTNINLSHGVENKGTSARVHLVIDCIRNEWSDELFASLGYDFEEEARLKQPVYTKEMLVQMIENLSLIGNEASEALIADFKQQLASMED